MQLVTCIYTSNIMHAQLLKGKYSDWLLEYQLAHPEDLNWNGSDPWRRTSGYFLSANTADDNAGPTSNGAQYTWCSHQCSLPA